MADPLAIHDPMNGVTPLRPMSHGWGRVAALLVVVGLLAGVGQIDVPTVFQGPKGDESTYVSMALSAAYDFDLKFTARDLERFYAFYHTGPEGIFLKQGRRIVVEWRGVFPRVRTVPRLTGEPLRYGKAFIYPVLAAPFVRLFGLSGMLIFNVALLLLVIWCGLRFARSRNQGPAGALFAVAFVTVSIVPVYTLWLTSEVFNFSLVFLGLFLWLYKDGPSATGPRWLLGAPSDYVAALCLGLATFSKPPNALLIVPMVLVLASRRRWLPAAVISACFLLGSAGAFGLNGLMSGDLNYQGGGASRRTFYGRFPFGNPPATFESLGTAMATDDSNTGQMVGATGFWSMLGYNAMYFFVGRHAGLVPYGFPAIVAVALWLRRGWRRREAGLLLGVVAASAVVLLVLAPNSWNGGGGPPGNRYFLSLYPALYFVAPPLIGGAAATMAAAGGLLFLAPMLIMPFATATKPWTVVDTAPLRRLPIELTLIDDIPVRLNAERSRISFGTDPDVLLYFMDRRSWPPEGTGVWVQGNARTEIVVRSDRPLSRLTIEWRSPVANHVRARMAGSSVSVDLEPGQTAVTSLQLGPGVPYLHGSTGYVLTLETSAGFVPALVDRDSADGRFLGAFAGLTFTTRSMR